MSMSHPGAQNPGSPSGQAPASPPQAEPIPYEPTTSTQGPAHTPFQTPSPQSKPRVGLWVGIASAAAVIVAAAIATPFIIGAVQQGEAEREFDTAQAEVDEARADLVEALQTATVDAVVSQTIESSVPEDRVTDVAVLDRLHEAKLNLAMKAGLSIDLDTGEITAGEAVADETATGDAAQSEGAAAAKPEGKDKLRAAAEQLREEAAELREEVELIDLAGAELWEAQLGVVESAQQKGAELLAEASGKAGEDEAAALQAAIDALDSAGLTRGESDLGALLDELNAAWDAVQGSMVPVWEDINGTWCGGHDGSCFTIDLNTLGGTSDSTITYKKMWGGCFNGGALPKGMGGGANVLYCPAGVPTDLGEWLVSEDFGPFVLNEDESRDRIAFFHAPGGHWFFRQ